MTVAPAMSVSTSPAERGGAGVESLLNAFVAQTLDDLDGGLLDLETALRTLAHIAWSAGHRHRRVGPEALGIP
jgi:hypothetical protein